MCADAQLAVVEIMKRMVNIVGVFGIALAWNSNLVKSKYF